jgi:hypothetical protein
VQDLLESCALKDKDLEFVRKANETCVFAGEHELSQDDQDKIIELWERHC